MANLAALAGYEIERLTQLNGRSWQISGPHPGSPDGAVGGARVFHLISPPLKLEAGAGAVAKIRPGFVGRIKAVLARVKEDGAGAGGDNTITVRINDVALTGGSLQLLVAAAVSGRYLGATGVTGANDFGPRDAIDINKTVATVFTDGEIQLILVCEADPD